MRQWEDMEKWEQQTVIWVSGLAMLSLGYLMYVGLAALCFAIGGKP